MSIGKIVGVVVGILAVVLLLLIFAGVPLAAIGVVTLALIAALGFALPFV